MTLTLANTYTSLVEKHGEHQICDLPWGQLYVHSSGQVFPCNFLQNQIPLGNIATQSLQEIWHGEKMAQFRGMHHEQKQKDCGDRQQKYYCYLLHRDLKTSALAVEKKSPSFPKRLDIMVDSACNLKCVMCTNIYEPTGGLKNEYFWQANDRTWQNLEELELVGGEPLLSPHFYRLANLVSEKNSSCRWRMTTNAAYPIKDLLKEALARIRIQTFAISIDSLQAQVFEAIRLRSNFEQIMANVDHFRDFFSERNETQIAISFLIQRLNAFELPAMYVWARERSLRLNFTLLRAPLEHSVFAWPEEERVRLILAYAKANEKENSIRLAHVIKRLFDSLSAARRLDLGEIVFDTLSHLKNKPA